VQGGALWADVDRETQAYGLVAPGGVVSDTGVAGLTLGGGYGWVRRKYGLTVDQLVEAEVVTADGSIVTTNDREHPDLFWALRGGGGNFGVVTSFTFALNPLGPLVGFSATFYPAEEYASVLRGWREYADQAPDEVSSLVVTLTFPADPHMPPQLHDRAVTIVGAVHSGPDPGPTCRRRRSGTRPRIAGVRVARSRRELLDLTPGNQRVLLHRARARVRTALEANA
jgi:FAD/FMN-containing dehydrogenase